MKTPAEINSVSTSALAYLGDCVLELCVREYLVIQGYSSSAKLNRAALDFVRATAQAEAVKRIIPLLSEGEAAVFRRGRNIGHSSTPKSATVSEYRMATGMEALFGWLHLCGQTERIDFLFSQAYSNAIRNAGKKIPRQTETQEQLTEDTTEGITEINTEPTGGTK